MPDDLRCLTVMTPEGVELRLYPAGLYTRMLAVLFDHLLVHGGQLLLFGLLPLVRALQTPVLIVSAFVAPLLYHVLCEWYGHGQTLGKRCFGLRVVDAAAGRLDFAQILIRNLLRVIDFLPIFYLLGGVCSWLHPHGFRLGDLVAGTVVIRRHQGSVLRVATMRSFGAENIFLSSPRYLRGLRQALTPVQVRSLHALLLQRESLRPEVRVRLCAEAAAAVAVDAGLSPEILQTLPSEQLLRSALSALAAAEAAGPAKKRDSTDGN